MRNLSMKKFGTPIGAGPGMEIDVVGSAIVGRPSWPARSERRFGARSSRVVAGAPRAGPFAAYEGFARSPVVRCLRGFLPTSGSSSSTGGLGLLFPG